MKASQPWQKPDGAAADRGEWAIICCYASALVGWTCCGPNRSQCTLLQQSRGAGWAHDETAPEDLRRISIRVQRKRLRRHPHGSLNRQKAGLEFVADLDLQPDPPIGRHSARLTG